MKVVERDFTKAGKMKVMPQKTKKEDGLKGYLPFYAVDTREEADAIIAKALEVGEFIEKNGRIFETTLAAEQTLDNLYLAGDRLAAIHAELGEEREGDTDHLD